MLFGSVWPNVERDLMKKPSNAGHASGSCVGNIVGAGARNGRNWEHFLDSSFSRAVTTLPSTSPAEVRAGQPSILLFGEWGEDPLSLSLGARYNSSTGGVENHILP